MKNMFQSTTDFNQQLDDWNVASVNNMYRMFNYASHFNQPLNDWNVGGVTDMREMFDGATDFNQCLSSWADKTPPDVSVITIFGDSGYAKKVTAANVGPWCQGKDDNCFAPQAPG